MLQRNIVLLFLAQLIFTSGSVVIVTLGGIAGSELAPMPSLATLPISLMVVGTAAATVPAALLMQRIGRAYGFTVGALVGCGGALLAAFALETASFVLFNLGVALVGTTLAFGAQFRFAAAESVSTSQVSWAVSIILVGSVGGAMLGPELATRSPAMIADQPFQGALFAVAALYIGAACLLLCIRSRTADVATGHATGEDAVPARPLGEVLAQPKFAIAVLAGVIGQGVMVFIMTATPLSMHNVDGHTLGETARVIQAHVIAMYLPSLAAAPLIKRFGTIKLMIAGVLAMGATIAIALSGHSVTHYWWALVLLGVGWNFLFISGTTQLVLAYRPSERFRAQALNDFSVFGMSASASLFAGALLHHFGWPAVLLTTIPALAMMLAAIAWLKFRPGTPAVSHAP